MSAVARWGLSLRPAVEADIPFLLALRQATMTAHFAASGEQVTAQAHRERVLYRYENAQVIERGGAPAGLFKVTRDAGAWQLVQIQLSPELQGKGIGQALISELIAEARAAGASLTLHVLHQNPARHLYERLGFRVFEVGAHEFGMRLEA
jgi:ribosomal protein S18 acetylase RimI-like enzyme